MEAVVVGAGVIGLTSAIRLSEAGHEVRIVAEHRTPGTTSDVAAAIWFPYKAEPRERILDWGRATLEALRPLEADPTSGVAWTDTVVLDAEAEPWWSRDVDQFARASHLDHGGMHAFSCRVPVINAPVFMAWLEARAAGLGVRSAQRRLASLSDIGRAELIVNCTGLGARELTPDASMFAIRGQVARVAAPTVRLAYLAQTEPPTYIIPRSDGVVLGGTAQLGNERLTSDLADERDLRQRCAIVDRALASAPLLSRAVGLRPGRPTVRLERDAGDGRIIHNYGHGGSGVTLSWGCADEVVRLAATLDAKSH